MSPIQTPYERCLRYSMYCMFLILVTVNAARRECGPAGQRSDNAPLIDPSMIPGMVGPYAARRLPSGPLSKFNQSRRVRHGHRGMLPGKSSRWPL